MVKLSHGGYDGYGNTVVQTKKELLEFLPKITNEFKNAVVVEEFKKRICLNACCGKK